MEIDPVYEELIKTEIIYKSISLFLENIDQERI
jgi:hypothetical protein